MVNLETRIGSVRMETPLTAVSGTFGLEYVRLLGETPQISGRLPGLGAVVAKSITKERRGGNKEPRIIETPSGALNAIGLQNPGLREFIHSELPKLRVLEVPIIASIAGRTIKEYVECARLVVEQDEIDAVELNVSCPNVDRGGIEFGCDPRVLGRLVAAVRKAVGDATLIAKLTPNVTDIAVPARAAVDSGVDAISLINTLRGMAIDLTTKQPKLGKRMGGLSGPAIHPVAVYMVHRCYTAVCRKNRIPIIGIGGVAGGPDAVEMMLAGASSVGIGTALFHDNDVFEHTAEHLRKYLADNELRSAKALVGKGA